MSEQISRIEKESSYGGNYSEPSNWLPEVEVNSGAVSLYTAIEEEEQHLELIEPVEKVEIRDGDDVCIGLENMENMDIPVGSRAICEYVELPRVVEEIRRVVEWGDGMGIDTGHEFSSKEAVKDLVDKASQKNCFWIVVLNSDKSRYVVKCRRAKEDCQW